MWKPVRVLGLDGTYVLGWGKKRAVIIAVDMGTEIPLAVGYVDEAHPQAVKRRLEQMVKRLGVSVIVTDDMVSCRAVSKMLDVRAPNLSVSCATLDRQNTV
jgi:hypothetical protein